MDNFGKDPRQTKRLLLAVGLSALILLGADALSMALFGKHAMAMRQPAVAEAAVANAQAAQPVAQVSTTQVTTSATVPVVQAQAVPLVSSRIDGVINTRGGQLDQLVLKQYNGEITDADGYTLLSPFGGPVSGSYVAAGWVGAGVEGPTETTVWSVVPQADASKVVLEWANTTGQTFQRTIMALPDSYLIDITDNVKNTAGLPVSLTPYVQVRHEGGFRHDEKSSWVNYFGPMGVVEQNSAEDKGRGFRQFESKYDTLKKKGPSDTVSGVGGWWGITSQYFAAAVLPETLNGQNVPTSRQFKHDAVAGRDVYTASVSWANTVVPSANGTAEVHYQLYTGPKHYGQLRDAGHSLDRSISWGWFEPLVKAFYAALVWFYGILGNWGLAVIAVTFVLKLVTFPLANKSYHSMAKMRKLQPKMEQLKERYKNDQQVLGVEMMKLYQTEKVNPLSGCWPMLIQIPIFFAMYKVVLVMFEFRHAPLGLWITDLSLHDPFFVLPVLMGASMFLQFKLNPAPSDPTQAMMFKWMPVFMTVMFLYFPAGLVLYWFVSNVLSIAQQVYIMRKDKAL